jgi:glycosyltransferase involved in cell wall biosynthesis
MSEISTKEFNTQRPKVALAMIVAGTNEEEAVLLANCLSSINGYVDEIFLQLNHPKGKKVSEKIRMVAEQYTDKIYDYTWTGNFVKARNDIFSKVPKEFGWVMWLDTDDTVDSPEEIQPLLAVVPKDMHGISATYDYGYDEYGNVTVSLLVNRVVRNDGSYEWKSSIDDDEVSVHEALTAKIATRSLYSKIWKVKHHASEEKRRQSLLRNVELLQAMYERHSKKGIVDPRILFYLATHYYDMGAYDRTIELLAQYLQLSGWPEERSDAHYYIGAIMSGRGQEKEAWAKRSFLEALGENIDNLKAYIGMAKLDSRNQRYDQAVKWLEAGAALKTGLTKIVRHEDKYELYRLLAEAYVNLGGKRLDDALKYANKALKLQPYNEGAKENRDFIEQLLQHRDLLRATTRIIRTLEDTDEKDKVLPLIKALPSELSDSIPVQDAYQRYTPPKKWPKRSIALYVGQSPLGIWGPWSMDEGGTGGSEEAVIRLSRLLVEMEWEVTVYGCPGERAGVYDGVTWKQYWETNAQDEFDVLISWRAIHFFDYEFKARKKYVWFHDVVPEAEITKDRIKHFDKAIFVSQYHADRPEFKSIPAEKKLVSANGIDPSIFEDPKVKRDPYRCIYMSANERGLRILLDIWPDVKKAVPKAKLDVYYGWNSFDAVQRDNPERMMWKASMIQKMKELDGVTERGRVGQNELHKEIFKSGIFAYPCTFPEVSCITAMKAQAGGAIPVTSDHANLKDIIHFGDKVSMYKFNPQDIDRYKKHLISWLLYPEKQDKVRPEMMKWARTDLTWQKVAQQWNKEMQP